MNIKVCGIQSVKDARIVMQAGADYIGLNFVPSSKRCVGIDAARHIINFIRSTPSDIQIVGVFQNQTSDYVNMLADNLGLNFVQLHGNETPTYCTQIEKPIIKAFSLDADFDVEDTLRFMQHYHVAHYLIDRKIQGDGDMVSVGKLTELAKQTPFFLAGGLTPENISSIVLVVKPYGVDAAGGVESDQTIDEEKVNTFIMTRRLL